MDQNKNQPDFRDDHSFEENPAQTENSQFEERAVEEIEACENCQEGEKESCENAEDRSADHEIEGSGDEEKGSCDQPKAGSDDGTLSEKDGDEEASDEDPSDAPTDDLKEESKGYSCSYNPPYYVPNFTVVDPHRSADRASKEKKQYSPKVLVACVLLSASVTMILGLVAGVFLFRFFSDGHWSDGFRQPITVTKNDGSIKVNEIVDSTGYDSLSVEEVVEYAADCVVEITTSQVQNDFFWGNYVTGGAGSGVIISENGYIMTNHHVVDEATTVTVRLTSGKEYEAKIIGSDADSDIAVLKIEETNLKAAVLGKSSDLKVGQKVVAIGNPLGSLGGTVTDGIISALDRQVSVGGYPMTLLQTNAAINPGNSGGGLFNMAGELIGVVNAKQSDTGIEGLGFAIPIDVAWQKASDLMKYGYVTGKLIFDFDLEEKTERFYVRSGMTTHLFPEGIYVVSSENDELKKYDRIVSANGVTINTSTDLYNVLYTLKKGDELKLVISRLSTSGKTAEFREQTVTITVRVTEPNS